MEEQAVETIACPKTPYWKGAPAVDAYTQSKLNDWLGDAERWQLRVIQNEWVFFRML